VLLGNLSAANKTFHESFMTLQEHFIAYCRYTEAVKLFRFMLSLYSLIWTCSNVQNCTAEMGGRDHVNLYIILGGHGITNSENPCSMVISINSLKWPKCKSLSKFSGCPCWKKPGISHEQGRQKYAHWGPSLCQSSNEYSPDTQHSETLLMQFHTKFKWDLPCLQRHRNQLFVMFNNLSYVHSRLI
jgi:hypothetical protein